MGEQDVSGTRELYHLNHIWVLYLNHRIIEHGMQYNHKIKSLLYENDNILFTTGSSTISLQNNIIGERNTIEEGSSTTVYAEKLLANPIVDNKWGYKSSK